MFNLILCSLFTNKYFCFIISCQRRDLIIRHECLKYFIVSSILKTENFITRCNYVKKLIQIASQMISFFGDCFGFGAIMAGLCHKKVGSLKTLWQHLKLSQSKEAFLYESLLRPKFINLLKAEESLISNTILPFVIQLCHLIECNYIVNLKLLPFFHEILNNNNNNMKVIHNNNKHNF